MFDGEHREKSPRIDGLEGAMAELAGVINAAQGRLVQLIAEGLEAGLWQQSGIHSPTQWLTWQLGISSGHAGRLVALAQRAGELPATMQAFAHGEVSLEQAVVVARHVPADHEASAVALARRCTVHQLSRALHRYSFEPATESEQPEAQPERRVVSFGASEHGRWRMHADLPLDEGAMVEQALVAKHHDLFTKASDDAERVEVTWADALVAVAEGSLTTDDARLPGSHRVMIHAHLEADPANPTGVGAVSLHLGSRLPSELRRFLTCDAPVRPIFERHGKPVSVGRTMRIVPGRTRRAVEHRDGGCAVPGCSATRFLQIHHIEHWEDGGASDTANLVALCRRHHRSHHLGELRIEGDADRTRGDPEGLHFADARGRPIEPSGTPRPPGELPRGPRYKHPSGEHLDPLDVTIAPSRAA